MKSNAVRVLVCASVVALSGRIWGQDTPAQTTVEEQIKQLAELGPGIHKVKQDERKALKSCVVVGQARISTALGQAKGLEVARRNARLSAEKEFVKWVRTNVASVETKTEETVLLLEGANGVVKESGKSAEKSTEVIAAAAAGAVRGLTVLGIHQDGENQTLTIVLGWSPENVRNAAAAEAINNSGAPAAAQFGARDAVGGGTAVPTQVPTKTAASAEAGGFLK